MVSKNLIIGGCAHYGIDQLTPWALSAIDVAGESDIVVVAGNTSDHTVDWLGRHGIRVFPMTLVPKVPVHVVRFLAIYEYLFRHWQDYDYVITTDTKDVYFQADPFQELQNKKLVVASGACVIKMKNGAAKTCAKRMGDMSANGFETRKSSMWEPLGAGRSM